MGLPQQRAEEVSKSIQLVKDCGARPYLAEYSPIPGTGLWSEALRVSPFDLEEEPLFHNNSLFPMAWERFTVSDMARIKKLSRQECLETQY